MKIAAVWAISGRPEEQHSAEAPCGGKGMRAVFECSVATLGLLTILLKTD